MSRRAKMDNANKLINIVVRLQVEGIYITHWCLDLKMRELDQDYLVLLD